MTRGRLRPGAPSTRPAAGRTFVVFSPAEASRQFQLTLTANRVRLADGSVVITLPNGQKARLIDTPIGGTVVNGTIFINPNSPLVNGTAEGYGEPGVPTPIQVTGGLMIHEELHVTGDLPPEGGFTVSEIMEQSKKHDMLVNTFCVDPAARREFRANRRR